MVGTKDQAQYQEENKPFLRSQKKRAESKNSIFGSDAEQPTTPRRGQEPGGDDHSEASADEETVLEEQECLSAQVDVSPPELLVLPGQNATFMCRVAVPLQYCRVVVPGRSAVNLNSRTTSGDIAYHGAGLEAGQCGFVINRVDDMNNGVVKCTLGILTETLESVGTMQLVVAHAPKRPELDISRGTDSLRVYKLNDQLQASCMVKDGRPAANISWYLDDEQLYGDGLGMPTVMDYAKESTQTKIQNFTRILRASDNGKNLRCVAYHPAYPTGKSEISRRLDVKYAPLPLDGPLDKFGYQLGEAGVIKLTIEANPKPQIEWNIDGQRIKEGSNDNTGRMEAESAQDLGKGKYSVNLRIAAINKQDTEKEYILTAYNDMGSQTYRLKISTSPEPEGLELGAGAIIGIVAAILILLLCVFIIVFARMSGRWCFKRDTVMDYTGGDYGQNITPERLNGDGVDNPHHQVSQEYINGNDLHIKKKDEKINTPV